MLTDPPEGRRRRMPQLSSLSRGAADAIVVYLLYTEQ